MNYNYSPSINGFYPDFIQPPEDAVACTRELYGATRNPPLGKLRRPGPNGLPELVDDPNYQPPELADFIAAKHAEINTWRDNQERENLLFDHDGQQWDGGVDSKNRMDETLALANALGGLPADFFWTTADNQDIPMDLPTLQALAGALAAARGLRGFDIHARQRQMKAEVAELTNIDAVTAYLVGWPQ